ncbi:MAG TPA: hypothetical protein VF525_16560 [Pyrinomonadaceae bacterium]
MHRRRTLTELRNSRPPSLVLLKKWSRDYSTNLLGQVWQAYDLFRAEVLSGINASKAEDDLERDITMSLERRIRRVMTGDEPYIVQHGPYEEESRKPSPAQPPQYDIAFVMNADERVMWPLEAKVLKSDSQAAVAAYAADINNEYLTCRYAPFSSEGAMLGYLMSGDENVAFKSIEARVPCTLTHHPYYLTRQHKTSSHVRKVPSGKSYSCDFRCHHLLMRIAA